MLRIDYEPTQQMARLEVGETSYAWEAVRRAINEKTPNATQVGSLALRVPWWEFLSCREAVFYHASRGKLEIQVTAPAEAQLKLAIARLGSYRQAKEKKPMDETETMLRLRALGFTRPLTVHQLRNLCRIAPFSAGAEFSIPGAGKTSVALAFYSLHGGGERYLLVVAPKNAFAAWEEQLSECYERPPGRFVRLTGGRAAIETTLRRQRPRMMLITYHQLNTALDVVGSYVALHPALLFLDESHRMKKGRDGPLGQAALSISHLPESKLILSGTPMPNSAQDLVAQFDFLYPEVRSRPESVVNLIQPVYARTTSVELGLPKPKVHYRFIEMSESQRAVYDLLKSDEKRKLAGVLANDRILLRRAGQSAMRLLQLTSNPALVAGIPGVPRELMAAATEAGGGPKLEYVCARARELANRGEKVVVWSSFVSNVELIAERLADVGAVFIHGGVETGEEDDDDTREGKIRAFHDQDETMVLVANPAACGEGISLHKKCHRAVYLDRTYNAAQYLQSRDRIHRLGLPEGAVTRIEIVISRGTIDELVKESLRRKITAMAKVLNDMALHDEINAGDPDDPDDVNLTMEDFRALARHLES
jgi:superfamily II DNA or RNA helicase